MNLKEPHRRLVLEGGILLVVVGFFVGILTVRQFAPTVTKILAGLVLAMIFLGTLIYLLLERQTRKDVLKELEERIGWVSFQTVKEYLQYKTSFNISLDNRCPESIKKKVLQYFDDIGFECRVVGL
jgi:hypothetical protein